MDYIKGSVRSFVKVHEFEMNADEFDKKSVKFLRAHRLKSTVYGNEEEDNSLDNINYQSSSKISDILLITLNHITLCKQLIIK